ncbi:hypothetical protein GBK02_04350 [Dechloromonas sp. TW-R-39-2]|uniref:O-antigen ligase family protein n=1 Tax=Dechloromonas sp. TW-R-39-2 TaxID=2654218 RepID=UPI00193E2D86|nr:O-antigen ligase family protein [Dechloromonas sp. TW-R-39-2]QRM18680.1 hypothetical protein GBK02_04350 [Dechloromonas sp. TW-R-39-2]
MNNILHRIPWFVLQGGVLSIGFSAYRDIGATIYDIFFLGAVAIWVLFGFLGFSFKNLSPLVGAGFLACLSGFFISDLFSGYVFDSLVQLSKFCFSFLVFYLCLPMLVNSQVRFFNLMYVLMLSGAISGIGSLLQATIGIGSLGGLEQYGRMTGFTEHPNELGFHCAMACFVCIYIFQNSNSALKTTACAISFLLSMIGLVLSSSMTSVGALLVAIFILTFYEYKDKNYIFIKQLFFVALVSIFCVSLFAVIGGENNIVDRIVGQKDLSTEEGTLGLRFIVYELAVEDIINNPFVGVGNSDEVTLSLLGDYVHNIFLRSFREGGILSFIGMLGIFAGSFSSLYEKTGNPWLLKSRKYMIAIFALILISVSLSPALFQRIVWLSFGVCFSYYALVVRFKLGFKI